MINRRTMILLTLTVVCLTAAAAVAQNQGRGEGHGRGMGQGREGHFEMMVEHLDLTEAQQEAIVNIHEENKAANLELSKESRILENELEGELLKDEPSQDKVLDLNKKLGDLRTERRANGLKTRLEVRNQLTPEQRDQMLAFQGPHGRGGKSGGRGHGAHGGHGNGQGNHCRQDAD
jgi:Spy/CpxP family protein refolding chaperone